MLPARPLALFLFVAVAVSTVAAFGQNPFLGTWKQNNDKSKLVGEVIEFAPAPDGAMKYTSAYGSYRFKTDGKPYADTFGTQYVWKMIDASNYQESSSMSGGPSAETTYKLSPDGKTLGTEQKGSYPGGDTFAHSEVFHRVTGSQGLIGKWKDVKIKAG